jgi:hypothetical protein
MYDPSCEDAYHLSPESGGDAGNIPQIKLEEEATNTKVFNSLLKIA